VLCIVAGQQPSTQSPLIPPGRTEERIAIAEVRKLMGQNQDSFTAEGKGMAGEQMMQMQSLATFHKQTTAQPAATLEVKLLPPQSLPTTPVFIAKHEVVTVVNIPLVGLGQLSQLCPLPTSWPNPCLLLRWDEGAEWEKGKALHCSSTFQQ